MKFKIYKQINKILTVFFRITGFRMLCHVAFFLSVANEFDKTLF